MRYTYPKLPRPDRRLHPSGTRIRLRSRAFIYEYPWPALEQPFDVQILGKYSKSLRGIYLFIRIHKIDLTTFWQQQRNKPRLLHQWPPTPSQWLSTPAQWNTGTGRTLFKVKLCCITSEIKKWSLPSHQQTQIKWGRPKIYFCPVFRSLAQLVHPKKHVTPDEASQSMIFAQLLSILLYLLRIPIWDLSLLGLTAKMVPPVIFKVSQWNFLL